MARLREVGGTPVNKNERLVVNDLCSGLPDEWLVVPNIEILGDGQYWECDAFVLAPRAALATDGTVEVINIDRVAATGPFKVLVHK